MPRQVATSVENNFTRGLITEASGLNFPENACTETYDCKFNLDGSFERRLGFDFEGGYATKTIDRTDVAVSSYLWRNVAGNGNTTLVVLQVGGTLYFYETSASAVSTGAVTSTITLSTYLASGAPSPNAIECQFSSGSKYLVVTHPYCDPFLVSYDTSTQTASGTLITIKIRDFEGDTADAYAVDTRPTSTLAALDVHHHYNLFNQGWVTANLTTWDTAQTTMPSNADVMWTFKDASEVFQATNAMLLSVINGNSRAPKGHYILTLSNQDRDTASGLSGTTATTTSYFRPSTSAFYAGRVFYAGIPYANFNSNIYFTQILERDVQYGYCYQAEDPTSETIFDLLSNDGGVISIKEAGTIIKLFAVSGALLVFANNGIWMITGSTGLGFTATDYSIQKITTINAISASSFVDVGGYPAWWNNEGIYILVPSQQTLAMPTVKSLTLTTVKSFYDAIPAGSKYYARGFYNTITGIIQWVYKSTDSGTPTEYYTFDRILNFNINTNAFYPWIIPDTAVTVNGIVVLDGAQGIITQDTIVDDAGDTVIDDAGDTIINFTFAATGAGSTPIFKYITSYVNSGSYKFTFSEENSTTYLDWFSYDSVGASFESYLISGYKLHGEGQRKFQPAWLTIYSNTSTAVQYTFQSIWDYAVTGTGTGRWSTEQAVSHTNLDYSVTPRRLKVRGHGKALQFKITSVDDNPFDIAGWVGFETANAVP